LGVLKEKANVLFEPRLSEEKLKAIKVFGLSRDARNLK